MTKDEIKAQAKERKTKWWADVKAGLIPPPKKRGKGTRPGLTFKTKKPAKFGLNKPRHIKFRVVDDTLVMLEERMRKDKEISISLADLYQLVVRTQLLERMRKRKVSE